MAQVLCGCMGPCSLVRTEVLVGNRVENVPRIWKARFCPTATRVSARIMAALASQMRPRPYLIEVGR